MPGEHPTIASAYVQLIPKMEGAESQISEALGGPAKEAGESAGEKAGSGFGSKLGAAAKVGAAAVAAVGAAATAAVGSFVSSAGAVAEYGDSIDKASQKMGISAEAYQEWDAILQHSGTSIGAMSGVMRTLNKAVEGNSEAFAELGISQEQLANMNAEEVLSATISALQGMEDGADRTALATELLGRGAQELGPLLNTSAEATEAMRQRVHELGGVMSNEAVAASAAYQDSLQDMTTAFSGLKNNLMTEFMPAMSSVMDGVTAIFTGDQAGIGKIKQGLGQLVGELMSKIPEIAEVGGGILSTLIDSISSNLPMLITAGLSLVQTVGDAILQNLPILVESGLSIIVQLAESIGQSLPELIPTIVSVVLQIVDTLTSPDTLSTLVDASIAIIMGLAEGLINALPELIAKAPEIIGNLVDAIVENAPKLLGAAAELIWKLVEGIGENLGNLLDSAASIVFKIADGIAQTFGELIAKGKEIVDSIKEGFWQKIEDAKNWGKDLINNFINGIKEKWNNLKESVSNIAGTIKSLIGFSEPEEGPLSDFHTFAPDMMMLFAQGIRDNEHLVREQLEQSFDFQPDIEAAYDAAGGMMESARVESAGTTTNQITINVHPSEGMDERKLAQEIERRLMIALERRQAAWA